MERQVAEAVQIQITCAEKILNSKAEYLRSRIPRITAAEEPEELNLGDKEELMDDEVFEEPEGEVRQEAM